MTAALKKHLIRCESAMNTARDALSRHEFPTDSRTLTVIGFISVLAQHQESVLLLVLNDNPASASALVRPVVEGAFRAIWFNNAATDADVEKFNQQDKINLTFGELTTAIDEALQTGGMFKSFKDRTWDPLNSFTHGGMHQIARCFLNREVAKNYNESDLREITTLVTLTVLLAIALFLEKHGHSSSVSQIQAMLPDFDV